LLLLLPLVLATGACKVNQQAFEDRIFSCDTTATDPLCGTDAQGFPLTCFAARRIGGTDFCTKACGDTPGYVAKDDAVCVQGNAELQFCDPADDADKDGTHPLGACNRSDLGCLRTDVETGAAEGICITGSPCTKDVDCHDPVRSTCAATFLNQLYANAPDLAADHLYCLQEGCLNGRSDCSPGEVCLPTQIPPEGNPPDICVPKCDSQGRCPPNHFCLSKISGPANPDVCIPGLLGFVCESDVDCLVGKCKSDDDAAPAQGLKLCTTPCSSDTDCSKYDSVQGAFICSTGTNRHCVTPSAYTGALCRTTADCSRDKGTICAKQAVDAPEGTCLFPCDAGQCTPRGGIGHTCVPLVDDEKMPVCFPGVFPLPCFGDSQCAVPELHCVGADVSDPQNPVPGNCTLPCKTDADCDASVWTTGQSFCSAPDPMHPEVLLCLPTSADGSPCSADDQCTTKVCAVPTTSSSMTPTCGGK
jgi:hypothetical protein